MIKIMTQLLFASGMNDGGINKANLSLMDLKKLSYKTFVMLPMIPLSVVEQWMLYTTVVDLLLYV